MHPLRQSLWILLLVASTFFISPSTHAQGNSQAAAACQKGGWQLVRGVNGEVFANQGQCVSYAARSGELPVPTVLYVDMGNPASEASFSLQGWGTAEDEAVNPFTSPFGDVTKRFQLLNQNNSLTFAPVAPGAEYQLTAEVEDGICADDFEISANGTLLYTYNSVAEQTLRIPAHVVDIPGELITGNSLVVTFHNSSGDGCGRAAVYNVQIALA